MKKLWKITCKQAHVMLSERMDRPLGPWDAFKLRMHLAVCDVCLRVNRQMSFMREAIRRLGA